MRKKSNSQVADGVKSLFSSVLKSHLPDWSVTSSPATWPCILWALLSSFVKTSLRVWSYMIAVRYRAHCSCSHCYNCRLFKLFFPKFRNFLRSWTSPLYLLHSSAWHLAHYRQSLFKCFSNAKKTGWMKIFCCFLCCSPDYLAVVGLLLLWVKKSLRVKNKDLWRF